MAAVLLPTDVDAEVATVVPVASPAVRLRQRGYNQAELLARAFAARTGRQVRMMLRRTAGRGSQTVLQPVARRANVAGAFEVDPIESQALAGAHVLLVDDVMTTGATALECAAALEAAGARCTSVLTFARALDARRILGI